MIVAIVIIIFTAVIYLRGHCQFLATVMARAGALPWGQILLIIASMLMQESVLYLALYLYLPLVHSLHRLLPRYLKTERRKKNSDCVAVAVVVGGHLAGYIYFLLEKQEKEWPFVRETTAALRFLLHPIQSGVETEGKGQAGCLRKLKFDPAGKK